MFALIASVIFFSPAGPITLAEIVMVERFTTVEECVAYSEKDGWGHRTDPDLGDLLIVHQKCDIAPRLVK